MGKNNNIHRNLRLKELLIINFEKSRNYCHNGIFPFMKYKIFIIFTFLYTALIAQQHPVEQDSTVTHYIIIEGDSIPRTAIDLDEVLVLPDLNIRGMTRAERVQYLILRRKTLKVYPYAKLAAERLVTLQKRLNSIKRKSKKREYSRRVNRYIEDEFSAELKKLTKTEGQILIKLIHRQTGTTAFNLIKQLRSGWKAFWYNNTASLFDISLKREFNPLQVKEDYLIEDILQRAFQDERLERQKPAFEIDFYACVDKWKPKSK